MKRLLTSLILIIFIASNIYLVSNAQEKPTNTSHSWFITVNLDTKTLTVYDNNIVYKSYPVAIGKKKTPTPSGQFVILKKTVNPAWGGNGNPKAAKKGGDPSNPLGPRWLGTSAGLHPGDSIGIHGNVDPKSIGTRASHGCMRMRNNDVIEIYKFIPINTPVWIGSTKKLALLGIK